MVQMALQHEPPVKEKLLDEDATESISLDKNEGTLIDLTERSPSCSSDSSSPGFSPEAANPSELLPLDGSSMEILLGDRSADESNGLPPSHDCLQHPTHRSCDNQLAATQSEVFSLQEAVKRLEEQLAKDAEKLYKYELLEQTVAQQEKELDLGRQEHSIDLKTIESLKNEMEGKISALRKQYETANREKETMVVRYAKNEKELLDQKKARDVLEKKLKDISKDNETAQSKLKTLFGEKAKLAQSLETKSAEVSNAYKEIDKLKDDINSRDIKIKWTQSKLKSEMEEHKECPSKIETLEQTTKSLEAEIAALKKENLSLERQLEGSEVNKNIESQLKEQHAKLIMEKHEKADLEAKLKEVQSKLRNIEEKNEKLSCQILDLEEAKLAANKEFIGMKEEQDHMAEELTHLRVVVAEMEDLRRQLAEEREKLALTTSELEKLRQNNEELSEDMSICRSREAEMVEYTQQLTVKNVQLQSEFSAVEEKATELEKEEHVLEEVSSNLKLEVDRLKEELQTERTKRHEESRLLARQVAEKTTKSLNLEALLTDTQSELNLLRQKHTTALKELQKELHLYRKRDELDCNGGGSSASGSDSVCQGSRTSSLNSLNDSSSSYQVLDVPVHTLIERIVKLQNDCAKQTERIEFLEEHAAHLVKELQKKSKLLQNYIMREQTGALTSKIMDRNKAEQSKHGGIMASLYSSKPNESMTLELSMEINRKLQAVLEDTLLKNITLKENLDTLGDEIARLSLNKT